MEGGEEKFLVQGTGAVPVGEIEMKFRLLSFGKKRNLHRYMMDPPDRER